MNKTLRKVLGKEVLKTSGGSCVTSDFGVSGAEPSGSAIRNVIIQFKTIKDVKLLYGNICTQLVFFLFFTLII